MHIVLPKKITRQVATGRTDGRRGPLKSLGTGPLKE
jgi:hypothetical protein